MGRRSRRRREKMKRAEMERAWIHTDGARGKDAECSEHLRAFKHYYIRLNAFV